MAYKFSNIHTLYSITCLINNKIYIGVADVYARRVNQHKALLRQCKHRNRHLQGDYDLYGSDRFVYDIIAEYDNKIEAYRAEKYYTDYIFCLNKETCYNLYNGGIPCFVFGTYIKRTKEHIEKSLAFLIGHKQSKETKNKRSTALKGRTFSREAINKMKSSARSARMVIDLTNNKVYNSLKEASEYLPEIKYDTLLSWMNNPNRNKTNLRWHH